MKTRALVSSVLFLCLLVCQCAAVRKKVEVREIWQSGGDYIRLFQEVGKSRGFEQPAEFHEQEVRQALKSLFFSRHEYFHWSTASRVFDENQLEELARFFRQAFMEAGPDQEVEFYLTDRTSRLFGISKRTLLTRGTAFVKGGSLHFHFDNIREQMTSTASGPEAQERRAEVAWKLVPQAGQQFDTQKDFLGNEPPNLHWIQVGLETFSGPAAEAGSLAGAPAPVQATPGPGGVGAPAPTALPAGGATLAPGATPPALPALEAPARERLRELKQMLDEGLISPQDYERKKKEIVDAL